MKSEPSTVWSLSSPQLPALPSMEGGAPPLTQALIDYQNQQRRRYHVPAHAGLSLLPPAWDLVRDPYRYDLSELEGLDVLSEPFESILEAQTRIAELFGVAHSYLLINGASVGLTAAMLSVLKPGETVLLPRNVHRSVLSGLILAGARPVWFLPERLPEWGLWGAVSPTEVEAQLAAHPEAKALFITSPTYEGIGSDVTALAELCRSRGICLIVDEAHGGLWPFSEQLPTSAVHLGADIVIHSMHKSGCSLTQSALAHLPKGSKIDPAVLQQALNTLQTTSPSYLLMSSLEATCHALASPAGRERLHAHLERTHRLRENFKANLTAFQLFEPLAPQTRYWDPCKLYLTLPQESGEDWGARLEEEQQLSYESASPYGVLYLSNLGLLDEDLDVLQARLLAEDARLSKAATEKTSSGKSIQAELEAQNPSILVPEMALLPRDAFFAPGEHVPTTQAVGRIAKETVVHCPPGIPVLFPGERITPAHLPFLPEAGLLVVAE
jgi:arginine decarboxylase